MTLDRFSTGDPLDRERGLLRKLISFWDISEEPIDNADRKLKLGGMDYAKGVAIHAYDKDSQLTTLADGITPENSTITSARPLEPDNFVLRLHEEKGRGDDSVWALRLICEHTNKSFEREHRSTMFIDQCEQQRWAWSQDLFWVIDLNAVTEHPELEFNGAGFLNMLFSDDHAGASSKRGCLSINLSKNGGHISGFRSGEHRAGQLWHVFTLPLGAGADAPGGTGIGGPGQTGADGEELGCQPIKETELMLRRDAKWEYPGNRFVIPPELEGPVTPSVGDVPYKVFFYVDTPLGNLTSLDTEEDQSSNQTVLDRKTGYPIKGYVLIPETEEVFEDTASGGGLTYPKDQYDDEDVGTAGSSTSEPTHSGSSATSSEPMQMLALPVVIPP